MDVKEPGICYIKEEYLVPDVKEVTTADNSELGTKRKLPAENAAEDEQDAQKNPKLSKKQRKRGQNKNRPVYKRDSSLNLCQSLFHGRTNVQTCTILNCRYSHDLSAFMKSKPADIGDKCPVFDTIGYCMRGVTCRFARAHLDEKGHNIISRAYAEYALPTTLNGIHPDVQWSLRKREYDFSGSKRLVAQADKLRDERKKKLANTVENSDAKNHTSDECIVKDSTIKTTNALEAPTDKVTEAQADIEQTDVNTAKSEALVAQADKLRDERKKKLANTLENSDAKNHTSDECIVKDNTIKTTNALEALTDKVTAIATEVQEAQADMKQTVVNTAKSEAPTDKDTAIDTEVAEAQADMEQTVVNTATPEATTYKDTANCSTELTTPKEATNGVEKPIGAVVDYDTTYKKPPVDFANKLILSPLTTVGNLPFRRICKEFGADITCGEMACAVPIVKGLTQEWALTKRHKSEDVFGVQLCGNNPNIIAQAAQLLIDTVNINYIDLNIGCPIELIYNHGGGCALMRRTNILETVVRSCSSMSRHVPFTVKMRTGIYADKSVAHDLMPLVEEWGAAAVTLHGRSREQRYTKSANWQYIEECAAKVKQIPVIGNGDILNFEDYNEKRKIAPHVSSVMIGRGALIKPWIFKEIKEQKPWNPSSTERFDMLRKYVNYGLEHWGTDTKGVENTRRFLLEWQSFLYRYIPYELLACPPQQINQRPQKFRGRDEMETLMSSPNADDWVRLSEMLLGPVPDDFKFVPKHKANAY